MRQGVVTLPNGADLKHSADICNLPLTLCTFSYYLRSFQNTPPHLHHPHTHHTELTSEQTHAAFKEFVSAWNAGRLPLRFYTGLATAPIKRTSHQWGFKSKGAAAGGGGGGAGRTGMAAYLADQQEQ